MSRCFPFPPPGYEKKARPDDENLLAKEKHKEKKHKKEKKDREKRDKKDKDRSEEKQREKKDRKEKRKDKKEKRKDKDVDKGEKKKTSDEKTTTIPPTPPPSSLPPLPPLPPDNLADDTTEFKFLFESGKRNREDDERATETYMVQKINLTSQRRAELPSYTVESNNPLAETTKFVIERREENDENQKQCYTKDIEVDSSVNRSNNLLNAVNLVGVTTQRQSMEEKEKSSSSKRKHSSGESKSDKHKDKDREKKSSKSRKRDKKEKEEKTKEKKPDKDQEQIKLKEISKISDGFHNIKPLSEVLGKRKEPEVNGFLHENEVRPNKLPRPAPSSSSQITENGGSKAEPSRLSDSLPPSERKGIIVNNLKTNGSNLLPKPQVTADNGKKTEQSVHKISPPSNSHNKIQLQTPLSHPVLENGRIFEPCQTSSSSSQGKTGIGVIRKPDKKIRNGINGLTLSEPDVQEPVQEPVVQVPVSKPPPPPVKKPPHPDSKYLSQILTVPSVESPDFDDQEWLFGNKDSQSSNRIRTRSEPTPVWAEAIRVESDDITALPYVIPY